jgi:hypothetical protein
MLLGVSGEIIAVKAKAAEPAASPSGLDVIIIDNEDYESDRKGIVTFTHRKHALDYKVSCWECHHEYVDGKNIWSPWEETVTCGACHDPEEKYDNPILLQKAYHFNCKNCHKSLAKEKKKTGPYRKCYGCHEKPK